MRPTFTGLALRAYWACVFLWVLFFIICLGLGYPTLNRYDPGVLNGDAAQYRAVVMHGSTAASRQVLHRILIPNLAHPLYLMARGHVGTWDAAYFGLLIVNSLFASGTAFLLFLLTATVLQDVNTGVIAATLYLLNFAVSNLLLAGYVDSGEAFFFMLIACALWRERWWVLPAAMVLGCLAKETFLPLAIAFILTWAAATAGSRVPFGRRLLWTLAAALAGFAAVTAALSVTAGHLLMPWTYAASLGAGSDSSIKVAMAAVSNRNVWRWASLSATLLALALSVYHNDIAGAGPAFARPAFSIAGPLLTCSLALLIRDLSRWVSVILPRDTAAPAR